MAKCKRCNAHGLFLKLDSQGMCKKCAAELAKIRTEEIKVAGVTQYQSNILSLGTHNDDYDWSSEDLRTYFCGERVYATKFVVTCKLVPEPDNAYDKNAIRVEADDVLIGYVPKGKTKWIKELMAGAFIISVRLNIYGGKYKYVPEDEEDKIEKDKDDIYWARLLIKYYDK